MKILIFCWRDIKNPGAGGSEIYFHEFAKNWAGNGNKVSMICGGWKGCKKTEIIDGISIIRAGGEMTQYLLAPFAYFRLKEKPDIIIDVENGIPFFTPFFSRAKKILHIHHVHKDVWFREKSFPLALIGWILETKIMPLVYRKTPIITISKSSADEIESEKFGKVLGIANPGIELCRYKKLAKAKKPALLFMNRIKKYKGLEVLLKSIKILNEKGVEFDAWIAGSGEDLENMSALAEKNNLRNVKFLGRISEKKKRELMQKAWVFTNPSFKEGWGIVNIEANYFGTPVVGSNVGGIRDSVIDGKTGFLFKPGSIRHLAEKLAVFLRNKKLSVKMGKESREWALKFGWNIKAEEYLNLLKKI